MEGNKIRVAYLAPENSGVAYYRFWQPLENIKERGLIELMGHGFDFTGKTIPPPAMQELKKIADWADVIILGRRDEPTWQTIVGMLKTFLAKKVVLDIDDNIFAVSPYIPARQAYHPDGPAIDIHKKIAAMVDGIIVSTPALEDIYKDFNKTWVIPNGVRFIHPRKEHDGVNIGYMVSHSHLENALIIEPAVIKILQKHKNARFFYTAGFKGFMEHVPQEIQSQVSYVPFFPLDNYLPYVNNLKLDIGLAPLMVNDFNKCKSNIRVLEYWQNQTTVIASPLNEYAKTVTHGFDGYLSEDDEWFHWMDDLIQSPERRHYFMRNSMDTLKKYDINKSADIYYSVLREITNA